MRCDTRALSALSDGELAPAEAEKLRRHVEGCGACKQALAELEALKRGLGALPAPEGQDNWSVLVNRLAAEPPPLLPVTRWRWRRFALPGLALAVVAIAGGSWLRWHKGRGLDADAVIAKAESEFRAADEHYRHAVDELRTVAEHERESWRPPQRAEYDAAQAQLEAAVARCRAVAAERPADVEAEELLFAAYRKEIRFFEDQMMRGAR